MNDYLDVMERNLDYQHALIERHIAKAQQCLEYGKTDDASVHLMIAGILQYKRPSWEEIRDYEQKSLDNLSQTL